MRRKGVTLLELLIVMALLAILLLLSLVGWRIQIAKARDAERKADLHELRIGLVSYYEDHGCFPANEEISCDGSFLAPYMPLIPCDPINNENYKFVYDREDCKTFKVYTKLENEGDLIIGEVGCANGCGPSGSEASFNYYISSGNVAVETGGEEGVEPTCGAVTKYCFANICGSCCPGDNYRCNGAGNRCLFDASCRP